MDQTEYVKALTAMHAANQLTYRWPANNVITSDILQELDRGNKLEGKILDELGWAMNQHPSTDCRPRHDKFVKDNQGIAPYIGEVGD